jgi:uncharacterized protein
MEEDIFEQLKNNNIEFVEKNISDILFFRDKHGNTPLHIVTGYNSIGCLKVLLENDESSNLINIGNNHGDTPLHNAVYGNYQECLKILLNQKSIDINSKNEYGNTPLMYASLQNSIECIKILLEHGADTSIQNKDGMTFFELLEEDIKSFIKEYRSLQKSKK